MPNERTEGSQVSLRRILHSPEWLAVLVSVFALAISIATFAMAEWDSHDRAIKDAAFNSCITYTSNDGMRKLVDDIYLGSFPNDQIKSDAERNYDLALGTGKTALVYRHSLGVWMNYLDVIATGLDHKNLDVGIIRDCFAPSFENARAKIFPKIFTKDDYPRVYRWTEEFHTEVEKSQQ